MSYFFDFKKREIYSVGPTFCKILALHSVLNATCLYSLSTTLKLCLKTSSSSVRCTGLYLCNDWKSRQHKQREMPLGRLA